MVNNSTYPKVMILGAGSSEPYGFPVGRSLLESIPKILTPIEQPINKYILENFNREKILQLNKKLKRPFVQSIDRFLFNHRDDKEILELGKLCIGYQIFRGEEESNRNYTNNWYQYFFNKLLDLADHNPEKIIDVPIDIITFNYDRSYEWHFYNGLINGFPISKESAKEIAQKYFEKRVVHVHGSLGDLFDYPYGSGGDFGKLNEMANRNIRIVYEDSSNEVDQKIGGKLFNSQEIYFIGFGYLKENMDKLIFKLDGSSVQKDSKSIYGSCFELKESEIQDIQQYFWRTKRQLIRFTNYTKNKIEAERINLKLTELKTLDFIRTIIRFQNDSRARYSI